MDFTGFNNIKTIISWAMLACTLSAQAQWQFITKDADVTQNVQDMIFPVVYEESTCQLSFVVDDLVTQEVVISNIQGCQQPHYLLLDDQRYELPTGFLLTINTSNHLFTGSGILGNCSGQPQRSINGGTMMLEVDGQVFEAVAQSIFLKNNATYFRYESATGDISCSLGVQQSNLFDALFVGDFE